MKWKSQVGNLYLMKDETKCGVNPGLADCTGGFLLAKKGDYALVCCQGLR